MSSEERREHSEPVSEQPSAPRTHSSTEHNVASEHVCETLLRRLLGTNA